MNFIDQLKQLQESPNTYLEILKVYNKEVPMANLLAFFFRPKEKHGLGNLFIKALLKTKCFELDANKDDDSIGLLMKNGANGKEVDLNTISNVKVKTEVKTDDDKRIDILIEADQFVICIEFKINHELNNPLDNYQTYIEKEYKDKRQYFVVLTPYRKPPIGKAVGNTVFKQVILSHFIKNIKAELPEGIRRNNEGNIYLQHYYDFIQTIENRSLRYGQKKKLEKLITDCNLTVATAVMPTEVSEFWYEVLTELKVEKLSEHISAKYHSNGAGGFAEIKKDGYAIKIRIENGEWQIEKWTNKKEIIESNISCVTPFNKLKERLVKEPLLN